MKRKYFCLPGLFLSLLLLLCLAAPNANASSASDFTYTVSGGNATITGYKGIGTYVTIPSTIGGYPVTGLGEKCFYNCEDLRSVTIPDGVKTIGDNCFDGCISLASIVIPGSVTRIGSWAFQNCMLLDRVIMETGVQEIGMWAFYKCTNLADVIIPDTVTTMGNGCFSGSKRLKTFTIPSGVKTIPSFCFSACDVLTTVQIPNGVLSIGEKAFQNCMNLKNVTLPSQLRTLGTSCFDGCTSITSVIIPNTVTTMDMSAFFGCTMLSEVELSESLTSVSDYAFGNCSSLRGIIIPEKVRKLGEGCFTNCKGLIVVAFLGDAPSFGRDCFHCDSVVGFYNPNKLGWESATTKYISGLKEWKQLEVPQITTQPKSTTATEGSTVKFTVAAKGNGLTYQWQYRSKTAVDWSNSTSSTAKTAAFSTTAEASKNLMQFRCVVTDENGITVESDAATLTVKEGLVITTQPASTTVTDGVTATFKVVATGASSYQWQWRTGSTGTWANCSSATTGYNTATLKPVGTAARNGYQYRCIVKDASGSSVTSNIATMTVAKVALAIVTQPVSTSVTAGSTATFKVISSGSGLSYQWQWRTGSTGTWAACSSATTGYNTATLKPVGTAARNGYQYRCVVKDASGKSVTSNAATLTVKAGLAITTQPASTTVTEGSTATFKVVATGASSYQWQWRTGSTGTWAACSSATTGYNTATLKPVGTAARNGYQYRCIVKDSSGKSVTSNTATLTVKAASGVSITTQPASTTVTAGSTATFKVVAANAASYQWQWRASSTGTWANCSSATTGYNTATLKPVGTAARNGYQYRCVVKDSSGKSVTSNTATLTVKAASGVSITTQPVSTTVTEGSTAAFKVVASGSGLTYQWQWRAGTSGTWAACSSATSGYNSATLKPVGTAARNGYQYRCIIVDVNGASIATNVVTLTVKAASGVSITTQPASVTVTAGSTATFKVAASGSGLTYLWQWRAGTSGTWAACSSATSGYNTAALKPVGTAARNGYQYRCVIVDADGKSAISNVVTLTVK